MRSDGKRNLDRHPLHFLEPTPLRRPQFAGHLEQLSQNAFQPFPLCPGHLLQPHSLRLPRNLFRIDRGQWGRRCFRHRPADATDGRQGVGRIGQYYADRTDAERDDGIMHHGIDLEGYDFVRLAPCTRHPVRRSCLRHCNIVSSPAWSSR